MPSPAFVITTYDSAEKAAHMLAREMEECLRAHAPVLFLSSGGSALSVIKELPLWDIMNTLTISVLDERFDPTNERSNFAALATTKWFSRAAASGAAYIDTTTRAHDTPDMLAERFEKELLTWRAKHPSGIIAGLFGMGEDGHTAGIFPMPDDSERFANLFESERLAAAYDASAASAIPLRVTATLTFIRLFSFGFAYVCGGGKKKSLERLQEKNLQSLNVFPAGILREIPEMRIATDSIDTQASV